MDFCTLFDSNYLDRGLALCESLNRVSDQFTLYIFTLDDLSFEILTSMKMKNVILISENSFLDKQLIMVKRERTRAEYCWTCTPIIIEYVLNHFDVELCTYIDADMYFYKSPQILIDEIKDSKCDVSIIEHRFPDNITKKTNERLHGKFCVEFNSFLNNANGRKVLEWWKCKCLESCSMKLNEESFGDQKYLDKWPESFMGIHILQNVGAGVAPWNLADYKLIQGNEANIDLLYKKRIRCSLIFYHFQNLRFLESGYADISVYNELGKIDVHLMNLLYDGYIMDLLEIREMLNEEYAFELRTFESRKGSSRWKYTGLRDLFAYGMVFINNIFRGGKNRKVIPHNDSR